MSMLIKKRQILAATLVVALVAATAVNWYYSQYMTDNTVTTSAEQVSGNLGDSLFVAGTTSIQSNTEKTTSSDADEYFAEAKLKRQKSYDEIIDNIEDLLDEENIDAQMKTKINSLISSFASGIKAQTDAENLISAKTGSRCIVVINDNACQVIMEKNTLNNEIILQITEIIQKNTNISAENLTIIELK